MIIVYGGCQADELVRDGQWLPWRAAEISPAGSAA